MIPQSSKYRSTEHAEIEVKDGESYTLPLQPGFRTPVEKIKIHFEPVGFSGRATIYQANTTGFGSVDGSRVETIELQEGDNWYGFEVEAQTGDGYKKKSGKKC